MWQWLLIVMLRNGCKGISFFLFFSPSFMACGMNLDWSGGLGSTALFTTHAAGNEGINSTGWWFVYFTFMGFLDLEGRKWTVDSMSQWSSSTGWVVWLLWFKNYLFTCRNLFWLGGRERAWIYRHRHRTGAAERLWIDLGRTASIWSNGYVTGMRRCTRLRGQHHSLRIVLHVASL